MKAKRFITRVVAAVLVLIMAAAAIPAYAGEFDDIPQVVFVSGVTITESGYWRYNFDKQLVKSSKWNYNVAYDAGTNTLTLKNATVYTTNFINYNEYRFETSCDIASTKDLNINLIGENTLKVYGVSSYSYNNGSYGILNFYGDTYVSGEGTLDIWFMGNHKNCGIAAKNGLVSIKDTQINFYAAENCSETYCYGIEAYGVEVENSTLDIDIASVSEIYGIYNKANGSYAKIKNSDVNINCLNTNYEIFNAGDYESVDYYCDAAYGFNIYQVDIEDSTVDVNIAYSSNPVYGIFTYSFLCNNSFVNCSLEGCNGRKNVSAIAYNNANINNDSLQQISTGSIKAEITPQDTYYSSAYINFGTSVFNPLENKFRGYYKCVNGGLAKGTFDDWNVTYNQSLNRLYMKDAVLNQPMRAMGSADIVLSGDNVLNCSATFAHYYDINQKFYGSGTLTLISEPACAIMCAEGVEFDDSVIVTASTSADGSNPVEFKSEDAAYYKWIKIQPTEMPPEPETSEEPAEESFFQRIINSIKDFFNKIISFIIDIFD